MAYVSLDSQQIKKANKKHKYSKEQVEQLEKCMDPKTGPLYFMETFMKIQHPTKGEMPFTPYPYQKRLIEAYNNHRFSISMLPRQTGKTTCASGYLIWYAMFYPDSSILIAAHKYAGASDIMSRVRYAYEMLPGWIKAGVNQYNRNSIEFDNGSKIMATTTTENTGRGMSLTMIYCDEFAFVQPPDKAKEFWTSLSPTLSTGGKCLITSTPNSDEDQFAMIWKEANKRFDEYGNDQIVGTNGFYAMKAHWSEHPDRNEEWAETERSRIGEERFRREHECEFLIFDETLISSLTLADMEGVSPVEVTGQVRWFKRPTPGHTYMVSLDPSMGTGGDFAAIQIFELPTFEQVGEWQHNMTPMNQQVRILQQINKHIHDTIIEKDASATPQIFYSMENNTIGEAALMSVMDIGEENIMGMFLSEPIRKGHRRKFRRGFNTTAKFKIDACTKFKELVESGKMKLNSQLLISELKDFVATGLSYKAKPGQHDDLVSACLLMTRMMKVLADFDPKIFEKWTDRSSEMTTPMPIFGNFYG